MESKCFTGWWFYQCKNQPCPVHSVESKCFTGWWFYQCKNQPCPVHSVESKCFTTWWFYQCKNQPCCVHSVESKCFPVHGEVTRCASTTWLSTRSGYSEHKFQFYASWMKYEQDGLKLVHRKMGNRCTFNPFYIQFWNRICSIRFQHVVHWCTCDERLMLNCFKAQFVGGSQSYLCGLRTVFGLLLERGGELCAYTLAHTHLPCTHGVNVWLTRMICLWTDICPGFQSQGGSLACILSNLHAMDSSDSPLVRHMLTSWWPSCFFP